MRTVAVRNRLVAPAWLVVVGPLVLAAVLLALLVRADPVGHLTPAAPLDAVAVERTVFDHGVIRLHLRNDGTAPVTVAQVMVDDAFRQHTASPRTLRRLETATVSIPYPWEEGQPVHLAVLTSTGVRITHDVVAATLTPHFGVHALGDYAMLGVAIGVVPVALGLLWLPALRRAPARWVQFFLALTLGLLLFLLVDTVAEGLGQAGRAPVRLRGVELFVVGFVVVVGVMTWLARSVGARAGAGGPASVGAAVHAPAGLTLAYLVAVGIGLHNLGEGLAVSSAVAAGEAALGASLVMGFAVHNTTEGLAIASPLGGTADSSPPLWHLVALAVVAGGPAVLGAWLGAFAVTPAWAALAFGVAAGAIAQVVWVVGRTLFRAGEAVTGAVAMGVVTGVAVMYATALLTG